MLRSPNGTCNLLQRIYRSDRAVFNVIITRLLAVALHLHHLHRRTHNRYLAHHAYFHLIQVVCQTPIRSRRTPLTPLQLAFWAVKDWLGGG